MKTRVIASALAVVVAGAMYWYYRHQPKEPTPSPSPAQVEVAPRSADPAIAAPPTSLRRVTPAQHAELAERIAAARARAAAPASPTAGVPPPHPVTTEPTAGDPASPYEPIDMEHSPPELVQSLKDAIPILSECFPPETSTAVVMFALDGDPDVGTLLDSGGLHDDKGKLLDPKLDDCLQNKLDTLELPPLPKNQQLSLQYTFKR
ncbi:MAG TPA: hypothetical protein VGM88_12075 [Kofleriaceae bacterium]|jgi:hypothetical protein